MKGEFIHPRTLMMLEAVLLTARAQFETSCASKAPAACAVSKGSVWNRGTLVTVIVDRGLCTEHGTRPAMADVEVWIYDISGDSPQYVGKEGRPENAALLKEPGDREMTDAPAAQPPLKN